MKIHVNDEPVREVERLWIRGDFAVEGNDGTYDDMTLHLTSRAAVEDMISNAMLEGVPGATGATGLQGIKGDTGDTGSSGVAGAAGATGATGAKGDQGDPGVDGVDGADGATGAVGAPGAAGATGAQGIQGATGAAGSAGAPGAQGVKGDTGNTGSAGAAGAAGSTGAQGIQGVQGVQGPAGATGWTMASKSSDQTVANSATLTDDSALQFAMAANTKYRIRVTVFYDTTALGDFKYFFSAPASPTLVRLKRSSCVAGGTPAELVMAVAMPGAADALLTAATNGGYIQAELVFHNGANAGTFKFQFAQNTLTNDTGAIVRAGSYLEYAVA